jgi:hypothetical protein
MVGDEVEQQVDLTRVHLAQQRVEFIERAEQRIDVAEIGDVVAEIERWRRIDRTKPNRVDAEPFKIVKPADNSLQIAFAVAIAVLE